MLSGLSRSSIYGHIRDGVFPRPVTLGPRMVAWLLSEVIAVNMARIRGIPDDEIRSLVQNLAIARQNVA